MLHGPQTPEAIDHIERTADDVLNPIVGTTLRSALYVPSPVHGVQLDGRGLAFSTMKRSEDGAWMVLRCVNLTDATVAGRWTLGSDISAAKLARLDETIVGDLAPAGASVSFDVGPRAITTILVR